MRLNAADLRDRVARRRRAPAGQRQLAVVLRADRTHDTTGEQSETLCHRFRQTARKLAAAWARHLDIVLQRLRGAPASPPDASRDIV